LIESKLPGRWPFRSLARQLLNHHHPPNPKKRWWSGHFAP
jgi:hypothetical protein